MFPSTLPNTLELGTYALVRTSKFTSHPKDVNLESEDFTQTTSKCPMQGKEATEDSSYVKLRSVQDQPTS